MDMKKEMTDDIIVAVLYGYQMLIETATDYMQIDYNFIINLSLVCV